MSLHYPALIVIVPLLSGLLIFAANWARPKLCFPMALGALTVSLGASIGVLVKVLETGLVVYKMGGWQPPMGIVYHIDYLNGPVAVLVCAVAWLNLIFSYRMVQEDYADRLGAFYALYVLFVTGLLGIVLTGDAFNLYVLLEISSLTGYALIGMGKRRGPLAALKYVFMGTIGATFYLLGVGYLYLMTGSLNMTDIAAILPSLYDHVAIKIAFVILMAGLFVKMALFPMHGWLSNAYTFAPSPSSGVIAPLTTKVMIYVMIRMTLTVFTPQYTFDTLHIDKAMVWIASLATVMGSVMALSQTRLKRVLTYVLIAEVGYMVGGLFLGNRQGVTGAILHVINDAAMTLCLFMVAGSILYKLKNDTFDSLEGLFQRMPFTMAAFLVAGMAIIGVPPTCGFFSKWYLILGGIEAGQYQFVAALLFSSLVNVVLLFKIVELAYFRKDAEGHHASPRAMNEAPVSMVVPLMACALGLIVLGLYAGDIVTQVIQLAIPTGIS